MPEKDWNELMARSIEDLDLNVRAYNCLENANIQTIGDLVRKTEGEMLRTKNFGRKSLNEIKEILSGLGLSFGMKLDSLGVPEDKPDPIPEPLPPPTSPLPLPVSTPRPWRGYRAHSRIDWGTSQPDPRSREELKTDLEVGCLLRFADAADSIGRHLPAILEIISASLSRLVAILDRALPKPPTLPPPPPPPVPDTIEENIPNLSTPLYFRLRDAGLTTIELVHVAGVYGLRYKCHGMGAARIFRLLDLMEDAGHPMPWHARDRRVIAKLKGPMRSGVKRGKIRAGGRWESR